jgi:ABC-2 type transport system permease protein
LRQKQTVYELLHSSKNSWTSDELSISPRYSADCPLGFKEGKNKERKLLAVALEGQFHSYYEKRHLPEFNSTSTSSETNLPLNFAEKSPEKSKLVLFGSNTFLTDKVIYLMSSVAGRLSLEPINIVQNSIDWSLNDRELLAIRANGHFARALFPPTPGSQMLFELMNYGFAIAGIFIVFISSKVLFFIRNKSLRKLVTVTTNCTRD